MVVLDDAVYLFEKMKAWSAMIVAYAKHGQAKKSMLQFSYRLLLKHLLHWSQECRQQLQTNRTPCLKLSCNLLLSFFHFPTVYCTFFKSMLDPFLVLVEVIAYWTLMKYKNLS